MALKFNPLTQPAITTNGLIDVSALGANAEISAYNPSSGFLYTVGGGSGAIVVSDLRDPAAPAAVAIATPEGGLETLQSAAVFGNLLAIAVQNTTKTDAGFVQFYDLTNPALPVHKSTVTVGALPDMVKFSGDGSKLLVTNEGEPDAMYTIDPVGSISLINTSGYLSDTPVTPAQADVQSVDFSAWENRRAELINRGIRIGQRLGITTSVAQDIEPEAIAISADGKTAWVSLQENNAIAVLDITGTAPVITSIFSAGIKDWSRGVASAENFSYELEYAAGSANQPAGVLSGGLSGLTFAGRETVNGTELDVYYSITDRGPNGDVVDGKRQFLDPDFQPSIYKLGMNRATGAITELGRIGLNRADGTPLTGLPQLAIKDDMPIDANGNPLAYDPFGIDSETVSLFTLNIGGSTRQVFAVGDEYRGQIGIFDATTGNLIQRYIPAGQKAQLAAQHNVNGATPIGNETIDSLPAVYGNRRSNRGIEGMAFNSTDGLLYAFMQSPLDVDANGDGVTEGRSRSELTRIIAIDPATGTPVKEHFYLLSGRSGQDKIGDVAYDADRGVFLVMERDSSRSLTSFKHVYEVDLSGATNTLAITTAANQATDGWLGKIGVASPELFDNRPTLVDHDSDTNTPEIFSTSSADALAASGIRLAHKIELFNLPSIGGTTAYDKPEGLTVRDDGALVINYDNDFGTEGASGNAFTVVSFDGAGFDSSDRDVNGSSGGGNKYLPIPELPVYGLPMPDGIATYTDGQGRQFLLAAGEGDSREYQPDEGDIFYDLTRANSDDDVNETAFLDHPGVRALNTAFETATGISATRLNLLNDYGDINGDGLIDKPFSIGSRSLRIYDDKGNVVFDSSDALETLANSLGVIASNRDDDKGTEPEMVEIATVNDRTYAFVALERTTTSVAAVFDITDPYNVAAVDPVVFPGTNRIEGITFLRSAAGEPAGLIASSEGNDKVSVTTAEPLAAGSSFKLQLFHLADQEGNISALEDAPRLSGVLNALRAQDIDLDGIPGFVNTLTLSSGDAWIPGLFYGASAQAYGAVGRGDVLIQNALGVQAVAFGNHEFDQGTAVIKDLIGGNSAAGFTGTAFPYLSGNLDFSTDSNLAGLVVDAAQAPQANSITSSVVFDVNGEEVGVVAATTPWLKTISSPGNVGIAPAPFSSTPTPAELDALAAAIQIDVDALIEANPGLNKVILLAHMQQIGIEQALAERLRHVDIIAAGGSNTRLFDSNDTIRSGDTAQGTYPIIKTDADGKPVVVVNTDGNYKYLGRLVLDFDADGVIIPESYDPTISGAYRTDAAGVAALEAEDFIDARVQDVVDNLRAVIVAQESEWFGVSDVFLNGNRNPGVRSEETNLGNLTADANLAYARTIDPSVMVSLKNGGGIRNSIGQSVVPTGSVDGTPELLPTAAVFDAQGNVVKPEGGISRNDIANALSFNNGLSLVSVTPSELKALIEHGIAAGVNQGRFPQVGGMAFSYDLSRPAGSRVVNLTIVDQAGNDLDIVVRGGDVMGDPSRSIRMVTLDFLAKKDGDGYPFSSLSNANRVDITDPNDARTGIATFASNGSEQDALAEYLATNHSAANPFAETDSVQSLDTRLQNLATRSDTVIPGEVIKLSGPQPASGLFNPGRRINLDAVGFSIGSSLAVFDTRSNGSILEQLPSALELNLSTSERIRVLHPRGALSIEAGVDGLLELSNAPDTITNLGNRGNSIIGGIGADVFEVNEAEPIQSGAQPDLIRDFQLGLDQLLVNTGSGQVVLDRNTEIDDLRGNPLLAGVNVRLTPDLRTSASRLQAISGQTSLLGAGLRLAQTDAPIRQVEIKVSGGTTLQLDLAQVPAGLQAQSVDGGSRILFTGVTAGAALNPASVQAALAAIRFQGSNNGSVEVRATDTAGLVATTSERPFVLVAPTPAGTLRPSVVRLDAAGGDLALQGVQAKALQIHGGTGDDVVRLSRAVEGRHSAYGFDGADVLSSPQGGRLVGGSGDDLLIGSASAPASLSANAGNDTLVGGRDNVLVGGSGNDLLIALGGGNVLQGGAGSDRFVLFDGAWRGGSAATVVTDFQPGTDTLVFAAQATSPQPVFSSMAGGTKVQLGSDHVATLVGVNPGDLNLSRDVITPNTSQLAALTSRFQDVADLQQSLAAG